MDLTIIGTVCYCCGEVGHIAIDCYAFEKIQSNMRDFAVEKITKEAGLNSE